MVITQDRQVQERLIRNIDHRARALLRQGGDQAIKNHLPELMKPYLRLASVMAAADQPFYTTRFEGFCHFLRCLPNPPFPAKRQKSDTLEADDPMESVEQVTGPLFL